jgi:manganese transport protein
MILIIILILIALNIAKAIFPEAEMTNSRVEGSSGRATRKLRFALMGPAFIAAIGYIDPGNFATNIQAGASFGYKLLWVVVWANLMAMLIQMLSAKLGIATGKTWRSKSVTIILVRQYGCTGSRPKSSQWQLTSLNLSGRLSVLS